MNLVSQASHRFSHHLMGQIFKPRVPLTATGGIGGKIVQGNNDRRCYPLYPRRSFADENKVDTDESMRGVKKVGLYKRLDQESLPRNEQIDKNFIQRMYQKYSMSEQRNRIIVAESLFQAATSQASDLRWYGPGRIGRDFRSYQAILTMHIWFLHKRLLANKTDQHNAALTQEELFDIFWIDSSNRMRAHGINEMLINKNLKKVQQYSFMHMFHYDHCFSGNLLETPADRLEALKMTIKTHVLLLPSLSHESNNECDVHNNNDDSFDEEILQKHAEHDDHAERIAWYVEAQFQNIAHDLPDSFFRKARIAWVDLPSFDGMVDGNTGKELPGRTVDPEDILPYDWTKSIANDGSYYYWNRETREALWERPV